MVARKTAPQVREATDKYGKAGEDLEVAHGLYALTSDSVSIPLVGRGQGR